MKSECLNSIGQHIRAVPPKAASDVRYILEVLPVTRLWGHASKTLRFLLAGRFLVWIERSCTFVLILSIRIVGEVKVLSAT